MSRIKTPAEIAALGLMMSSMSQPLPELDNSNPIHLFSFDEQPRSLRGKLAALNARNEMRPSDRPKKKSKATLKRRAKNKATRKARKR